MSDQQWGAVTRYRARRARPSWRTCAGGAALLTGMLFVILIQRGEPNTAVAKLPVGRPVTIAWAGDTTLGSSHGLPPENGWGELAGVADVLKAAGLTALNYEGTFSVGGRRSAAGRIRLRASRSRRHRATPPRCAAPEWMWRTSGTTTASTTARREWARRSRRCGRITSV